MDETVRILLTHSRRYPRMEIADYVKLLYQSVFGPAHFAEDPPLEAVRSYIEEETAGIISPDSTKPMFEPIGNGYHRVHLDHVATGTIAAERLAESFHASMKSAPGQNKQSVAYFKDATKVLLALVRAGEIPLARDESRSFIATYHEQGVRPLHHSPSFREHYRPHYRIVHENFSHSLRPDRMQE